MNSQPNLESIKQIISHGGYFSTKGESIVSALQLIFVACIGGFFIGKALLELNASILG